MDKYYQKAHEYIAAHRTEQALTTFVAGLDHGEHKCAYGIIYIMLQFGTYTMCYDEAISIFCASYPHIRLLAQSGDDEAMYIIAEGIRYGFVDDDEPYLFWLSKACELGNRHALSVMAELEWLESPGLLPPPAEAERSIVEVDLNRDVVVSSADVEFVDLPIRSECTLLADADDFLLEDLGITDMLADIEAEREAMRSSGELF